MDTEQQWQTARVRMRDDEQAARRDIARESEYESEQRARRAPRAESPDRRSQTTPGDSPTPGRGAAVDGESAQRNEVEARRSERQATERSMTQRVEDERAAKVLRQVQDPSWWNLATARDLEAAQSVAQRGGGNPATRARINREMDHVARTRYGTGVQGAIEYERTHPTMPPPDLTQRHDGMNLSR